MPHYYFDHHELDGVHRDGDGLDLADIYEAVRQAQRGLAELALSATIGSPHVQLAIDIRDEVGEIIVSVVSNTSVVPISWSPRQRA